MFEEDVTNKVVTRKYRTYYQYGDWLEVLSRYENAQVISAFLCQHEECECLRVAYGSSRRTGRVTTAKLCRNKNVCAVSAMGVEYSELNLVTNKDEHEETSVVKLEERILAPCLLLPYVISSKTFEQKFAVSYADWDIGSMINAKKEMSPSANVLNA